MLNHTCLRACATQCPPQRYCRHHHRRRHHAKSISMAFLRPVVPVAWRKKVGGERDLKLLLITCHHSQRGRRRWRQHCPPTFKSHQPLFSRPMPSHQYIQTCDTHNPTTTHTHNPTTTHTHNPTTIATSACLLRHPSRPFLLRLSL